MESKLQHTEAVWFDNKKPDLKESTFCTENYCLTQV